MARKELQLGDTQVIKDLLSRYTSLNGRVIPLETLYAPLLARVSALESALSGLPIGTGPSPFSQSLNFTETRNSMYVGVIS